MRFLNHIILLFLLFGCAVNAQNKEYISNLRKAYGPTIDKLTEYTGKNDSVAFFKLLKESKVTAIKKNIPYLLAYCYEKQGIWYYYRNNFKTTLLFLDTAITISKKGGLNEISTNFYMNKGSVHYMMRDFPQSLNCFKLCQDIMEKNNSEGLILLYGNMALLYQEIGDLENAKKYLYRSFPFAKMKNEKDSYAKAINNLALIHKKEGNFKAADSLFRIGYYLTKTNSLHQDFADITYNLVGLLISEKKYQEAKTFNLELLESVKLHKDISWVKQVKQNMAQIYFDLNDIQNAKKILKESEAIQLNPEEIDDDDANSLITVANLYHKLGMYDKASANYYLNNELMEKFGKEKKLMDAAQLSFKYEKHRDSLQTAKEKEIAELENLREQEKTDNKLKQQKIIIAVSLAGVVFVIVFLFVLIKANRNKEKANKEINYQKSLLTEKNKEITDSITYAKHIQHSLLPLPDYIDILLPHHFLLYLPKDIVSGDFYWVKQINVNEVFVAVADCTGHGVPGAMMSALSIQNLNELAGQAKSPAKLLSLLNNSLKNTLNQEQEGFSKDGLDICLCKLNVKTRQLTYSGANRSLQIYNESGLKQEIKATKTGIGGHTPVNQEYTEHEIMIEKNELVIMSTDGFADQFGGNENKKITTKRFKEWISEVFLSDNKKQALEKKYFAWKGNNTQIDDVCVLGFKI